MKIDFKYVFAALMAMIIVASSCQKGDLLSNPNVAAESSTVPAALIFNHIVANTLKEEYPISSDVFRWSQHIVSNYYYYGGYNTYNWSNTSNTYDVIKYCTKLDEQAKKQYGTTPNPYVALTKFYRAYAFIWLTQRVGDIPMAQAGDVSNLTPKYDNQHDVYKNCLALLDTANTLLANLPAASTVGGDIYNLTNLQWRKVINTYKLRILISLSKRADDNADLNIKPQFAAILADATKYPIMSSNSDNLSYKFTAITLAPSTNSNYINAENISKTFFNVTLPYKDPRIFTLATPSRTQLTAGVAASDFAAYQGEDNAKAQGSMSTLSANGVYSTPSFVRYAGVTGGVPNMEPYIVIGYPEMCFNIAEAANRGWIAGGDAVAATWYSSGIKASMGVYNLTQGQTVNIYDGNDGKTLLGTASIDINTFLSNVTYSGGATGLQQILTQKYVAFFMNSGFEAYYNWRRTGVPTMSQGGVGIGTPNNLIPFRWQYPQDEINYNKTNYTTAVSSQYGGTDDVNAKMWLIK